MRTHNDKGQLFELTYPNLSRLLDEDGHQEETAVHGVVRTVHITNGLRVHRHADSGRPRELHLMAYHVMFGWQKICEIGPITAPANGTKEDVLPGYVTTFAMWESKPVQHIAWKNRVLVDNDVEPGVRGGIDTLARELLDAFDAAERMGEGGSAGMARGRALALAVLAAHEVHDNNYDESSPASQTGPPLARQCWWG